MNKDLAVLIPGLTYSSKKFLTFITGLKENNFDNIHFYIDTWDHPLNDTLQMEGYLKQEGFDYTIKSERYEDVFDELIVHYAYEAFPKIGEIFDTHFFRTKREWSREDFLRRYFAIYYKFYKNYLMTENESFILRAKSNSNTVLSFKIDELVDTLLYNDQVSSNYEKNNRFNFENNPQGEILKSDNTVYCTIANINTAGQIKLNESAIFGHRNVFDKRLFGCYNDLYDYMTNGMMPLIQKTMLENKQAWDNNVNKMWSHPIVGSMLWGDFIRQNDIQIHLNACIAGSQDRKHKVNMAY